MPMDFPDLAALRAAFDHPNMLLYQADETCADYRERCAVWSEILLDDPVMAMEVRLGRGWDKWTDADRRDFLKRTVGI